MTVHGGAGTDGPADPGALRSRVLLGPVRCDGQHEVGHQAAFHGRIAAQPDCASVALPCITYHDPAKTGSTMILLDMGASAGPAELEESDAIRLLGTLEASGNGLLDW